MKNGTDIRHGAREKGICLTPKWDLLKDYESLFEGLIKLTWSQSPIPLRPWKPSQLVPKQWASTLLLPFELLPPLKEASEGLEGQKWLLSMFSKTLGAGEWKGLFVTLCCVRNLIITIWGSYTTWFNLIWAIADPQTCWSVLSTLAKGHSVSGQASDRKTPVI